MSQPQTPSLDDGQYTAAGIRKYEAIFGRNFISTGGIHTTREILGRLELRPEQQVLDIGCGIGGSAFYMAQTYQLRVHGVDLSENMLHVARDRCREAGLQERVSFERADILSWAAEPRYDFVHSRDAFLHIHDKRRLFQVVLDALRPGGKLLFTDYLRGAGEPSEDFAAYLHQRNYDLHTLAGYSALLAAAGFVDVRAEDRTVQFVEVLQQELARMDRTRLSLHEVRELERGWREKIDRATRGEQRWGLFMAVKAA